MQCPVCAVELNMMERQGVEIDYCPKCRGVWLDRGELDKIIERSAAQVDSPFLDRERTPEYERYEHGHGHRRKRRGFLGDLFDFD